MAKVFNVFNGLIYAEYTHMYQSAEEASKYYSPDTVFVDAPDYVFPGWGYNDKKKGDKKFIKPTPPSGWEYDDKTGTFYDPVLLRKQQIQKQIQENQLALDASDYKVIKSYEYSLVGEEQPYDISELHLERQALRDEINELKKQLEEK